MRVAKPSIETLDRVRAFKDAVELMLERENFSFKEPWEKWQELDDDDDDRVEIERLKLSLAEELDVRADQVDGRIVAYEYLKSKYSNRLGHIIMTADVLIDNVCDPMITYLDYRPSLVDQHVAPEQ